jgi:hypothetical protein
MNGPENTASVATKRIEASAITENSTQPPISTTSRRPRQARHITRAGQIHWPFWRAAVHGVGWSSAMLANIGSLRHEKA